MQSRNQKTQAKVYPFGASGIGYHFQALEY